jgi:hypothetical protein
VCGCHPGNSQCIDDAVCAWGTEQLDCPMYPDFPNHMGCYGFAFTMPGDFVAPNLPVTPLASWFVPFTNDPYFALTQHRMLPAYATCSCVDELSEKS